jgi:hypothetical protein
VNWSRGRETLAATRGRRGRASPAEATEAEQVSPMQSTRTLKLKVAARGGEGWPTGPVLRLAGSPVAIHSGVHGLRASARLQV